VVKILIRDFAPKQTVADQNALEQFQKQWSTYQKLVDADALSHRAAGKLLHDALYAIPRAFTKTSSRPCPSGRSPPMPPGVVFRSTICERSKKNVYSKVSAPPRLSV
jgi:hypothetical protein